MERGCGGRGGKMAKESDVDEKMTIDVRYETKPRFPVLERRVCGGRGGACVHVCVHMCVCVRKPCVCVCV